jgi:hypothetical protein
MTKITIDPLEFFEFEDDFEEFSDALEKMTSSKVTRHIMYTLEIEDEKMAQCVKVFFGTLKGLKKPVPGKAAPKVEKVKVEKKPEDWRTMPREQHFYTILDGPEAGKKLIGAGINKLLKYGKLTAGTHVSHPKRGNFEVAVDGDNGLYLAPVAEKWMPVPDIRPEPTPLEEAVPA